MVNPQSSPRPWLLQCYSLWSWFGWFAGTPIFGNLHTYITLHYITLHYITLHYITLHYITLHYITLHIYIYTYSHYRFGPWKCHAQRKDFFFAIWTCSRIDYHSPSANNTGWLVCSLYTTCIYSHLCGIWLMNILVCGMTFSIHEQTMHLVYYMCTWGSCMMGIQPTLKQYLPTNRGWSLISDISGCWWLINP